MASARPILGLISIIILAGGVLLQLLVVLSGGVNGSPVNRVYFLQASTDGITNGKPNIPNPARWTFFAICGASNGNDGVNVDCTSPRPALPFNPPQNFGTDMGVPDEFEGTKQFYYLSRFMFAFYLIALFFAVVALLLSLFALFARLGAYITGLTTFLALFFQALAAALMTAWSVLGRNAFRATGSSASIGIYGYAFTWAAFACFLISSVLFCVGGRVGDSSRSRTTKSSYFGRKRSTRSRGSFRDSESGRRVKDEYD